MMPGRRVLSELKGLTSGEELRWSSHYSYQKATLMDVDGQTLVSKEKLLTSIQANFLSEKNEEKFR